MNYVLKQYQGNTEEAKARRAFKEGMILYGYCNGIFGDDSYANKKIITIIGNYVEVMELNEDGEDTGRRGFSIVDNWVSLLESSNQEVEKLEKYET